MRNKAVYWVCAVAMLPLMAVLAVAADEMAVGEKAFNSKCAMCHGKDGKADTKAGKMTKTYDLTGDAEWKHGATVADVVKVTEEGVGKMKGYKGKLTPEEITAVAKYMLKLCGKEVK